MTTNFMTPNYEKILKALNRTKKGLTATEISERTGLNIGSTRTGLYELRGSGVVGLAGTETTGARGRPAYLYVRN